MMNDINEMNANEMQELDLEDMEAVAGGKRNDSVHDLKNFVTAGSSSHG